MIPGQIVACWIFLIAFVSGFSVKQAHVAFKGAIKKKPVAFTEPISPEFQKLSKLIVLDAIEDGLEVNFAIESTSLPERAILFLGSQELALDTHYLPQIKGRGQDQSYSFKVAAKEIPSALIYQATQKGESLVASLLLSSERAIDNIFIDLFDLKLGFDKPESLELPKRLGALPEIKHIFNAPPKTAPTVVAQFFSLLVATVSVGLVACWFTTGSVNFEGFPKGCPGGQFLAMMVSIVAMEYVFIKYYLGTSIFGTLWSALYVGLPGLWIGSKFLSNLK
ncbi:LAMI_0D13058g1_1 [Lachancea mirantina]|uniref:LAMI_0D13058g1_1 n=1 Tax=Lachancea mirantina TaxID=1230905 RepID=A0A1G4JG41_9SACH|nr:LAMI_0D13058g1_1 [Lachancea mirantina]